MIGAATAQIPQQPPQQAASAASIRFSPSVANVVKVATVAQRLSLYLIANQGLGSSASGDNPMEFVNLCLFLARGIDYAVANNEVLPKALELPALLKKICLLKDDGFNRAIIMVLMISVKNACKFKWFSEKDCHELLAVVDEIGKSFQIPRDTPVGSTASFSLVSIIMARYYPQLKMGQILTSLEVEPGYGAFVSDFAICKSMVHRPEEKVRLLVAQTDNIETSACIITPPRVSFLLNGRGVERRTNVFMDTGPQMPNNVAQMLKYGTNLLQAVGQFDGHYVIIIALMSVALPPDSSTLLDYVPATIAAADSDSDIIEVASRICLNCPISRTRIRLPVKGQFCKHRQCFDYSNFLSINSRKPSWRCPHCNRPVCFTDIRVDQNIAKVLQEVGDDISEVTITVDGSWKAVMECNDDLYETPNVTLNFHKQGSEQQKSSVSPNTIPNVLDLTGDDDEMDGAFTSEPEDRKPLPSDFLIQSIPTNPSLPSALNNGRTVTQLAQSGNNLHGFVQTPSTSNAGQEMRIHGGLPQAISAIVTSASAGVVSPLPAQDAQFLGNANFMDCSTQTQLSVPNNLQIQQSPVVNTAVGHEYRNMPSISRHATITEGMQAPPARAQTPSPLQRLRSMMMPGGPSMAPPSTMSTTQPLEGFGSKGMHLERQQHISRPPVNPPEVSNIPPSALFRSSPMQNRFSTGQSVQVPPVVRPSPGQLQGRPRTSSGRFQTFQNSHLQQALNLVTSPSTTHSPSMGRPILPRTPLPVSQTPGSSMFWPSAQQPAMPAQTPVQLQNHPSRMGSSLLEVHTPSSGGDQGADTGVHTPPSGGSTAELSVEQNWRPTRPMRGSISGRSHLDSDLNVIRPTQQAQVALPPSAAGSASPTVPPHQRGPNPITGSISHLGYPPGTQ